MSYARFGWDGSDVYVFEHVGGFIQCCACWLNEVEDGDIFPESTNLKTPREALAHLEEHVSAGHCVPSKTFEQIREEYANSMDTPIEPYVEDPEVANRRRNRLRELFEMKDEKSE